MSQFDIAYIHLIYVSHKKQISFFSIMFNVTVCARICIGGVSAGVDLAKGAYKSINGVLSRPEMHAVQDILYQVLCKIARLPSLFFQFLDFS